MRATICASGTPGCAGTGNSDAEVEDGAAGQVLLGYRIPALAAPRAVPVAAGLTVRDSP